MNKAKQFDDYLNFVGEVVQAGLIRDGLQDFIDKMDKKTILKLFKIYYAQVVNGNLILPAQESGFAGWGSFIKSVKSVITSPVKVLSLPTIAAIGAVSPSAATKLNNIITTSPITKIIDAPTKYFVENPQVAMAVGTAFTGGATLPILLATGGLAGAGTELAKKKQAAIDEYQRGLVVKMEATGQPIIPEIDLTGDPQKIWDAIHSADYRAIAQQNAFKVLTEQMGYDSKNPNTWTIANKMVDDSITDIEEKIKPRLSGGGSSVGGGSSSAAILPLIVGALTLMK